MEYDTTVPASDLNIGDTVVLKKAHPCGGRAWKITRIGADVSLQCEQCRHVVMLSRSELDRRMVRRN
ncbi:MAG: DUF951 domain-containing protein [Coriobacteriia bacterium]|nr:DUF951 domain-containing protein [Coriobacteriia bacterium]